MPGFYPTTGFALPHLWVFQVTQAYTIRLIFIRFAIIESFFVHQEVTTMTHLKVGDKAPDFTLPSHLDTSVSLSDLRGRAVAIAFFPLAWTPI